MTLWFICLRKRLSRMKHNWDCAPQIPCTVGGGAAIWSVSRNIVLTSFDLPPRLVGCLARCWRLQLGV